MKLERFLYCKNHNLLC